MMKFIHKLTIVLALGGICGLAACKARPQPRRAGGLRGNSFRYGRQNLASHPSSDKKPCSAGVGELVRHFSKLF